MSLPGAGTYVDPYPRPTVAELEQLKALTGCRCGERARADCDGLCSRCGRVADWRRWIA